MKLTRIEVFNFRKLRRARLDMSDKQTLLVGANNSGKTSAMKALRKFLKDRGGIDTRDVTASNWAAIEKIAGTWTPEAEACSCSASGCVAGGPAEDNTRAIDMGRKAGTKGRKTG